MRSLGLKMSEVRLDFGGGLRRVSTAPTTRWVHGAGAALRATRQLPLLVPRPHAAGRTEAFFSGAGSMVRNKKRRCATSRLTCSQTRACRRPGRATAAQPRQVTSPWMDGPRWSAIDGQPPRAWMSMPLRGRMWYFDYVHYTGAARTCWALRWRQVWRVWRVGRCAGDATLCCVLSRLGVVSVGVLYACLYALCTRFPRVSCVLG